MGSTPNLSESSSEDRDRDQNEHEGYAMLQSYQEEPLKIHPFDVAALRSKIDNLPGRFISRWEIGSEELVQLGEDDDEVDVQDASDASDSLNTFGDVELNHSFADSKYEVLKPIPEPQYSYEDYDDSQFHSNRGARGGEPGKGLSTPSARTSDKDDDIWLTEYEDELFFENGERRTIPHGLKINLDLEPNKSRRLTDRQERALLEIWEDRLNKKELHYNRPKNILFEDFKAVLRQNPATMFSLFMMEEAGRKPDILELKDYGFLIGDCSKKPLRIDPGEPISYLDILREADRMGVSLMSKKTHQKLRGRGRFNDERWTILRTPDHVLDRRGYCIGTPKEEIQLDGGVNLGNFGTRFELKLVRRPT